MKIEIEVPTLHDSFEVVGTAQAQIGDLYLSKSQDCWYWRTASQVGEHALVARKKRTLADWANEQELFKALAKMRSGHVNTEAHLCDSANGHKIWQVRIGVRTLEQFSLPLPPDGCPGNYLVLRDGKWELA